jgi:hypothetical protein
VSKNSVAFLNELIGLRSPYSTRVFAPPDTAEVYFFDHNYDDRARLPSCLDDLDKARRERGLDFSKKTLLLSVRGLDPHHGALFDFIRQFNQHHLFIELWNTERELLLLQEAALDNVYFLPVTAALELHVSRRVGARPNRHVFVSLGGDDDIELLRRTVRSCPDLHFLVPSVAWEKFDGGRREFEVDFREPNATRVPCSKSGRRFTLAYRLGYLWCDTVLIATRRAKRDQMRGGIRVADALAAQKRLVMAENPMCELLMAQHERTCLVAEHDRGSLAEALRRNGAGDFQPDSALTDQLRALTRSELKLDWMLSVPDNVHAAQSMPFFRSQVELSRDIDRLALTDSRGEPLDALFGLSCGRHIAFAGQVARVGAIRQAHAGLYHVDLWRGGDLFLELEVSTAPTDRYYRRTTLGHFMRYRGKELPHDGAPLLDAIAELL